MLQNVTILETGKFWLTVNDVNRTYNGKTESQPIMLHCAISYKVPIVFKIHSAFIFMVKQVYSTV